MKSEFSESELNLLEEIKNKQLAVKEVTE